MNRIPVSFLRSILALLAVLMVLGLAACGGDDSADCVSGGCEFGTCQDGQCANPSSCQNDYQCLPGYGCADGVCKALTACQEDIDCEIGVCDSGVCVNPDECNFNEDCFERTYCGPDKTCQPDPCNDFACQQGVCRRGTTECVSKESCTPATEAEDCVPGDKCLDGACYDEESFCDAIACERGECSFVDRGCVNADDCAGDDANCIDGFYCNGDNECVEDNCADVDCSDGGVCVPALGECENASPCASNAECLAGHFCVEGTCRLQENACGDPGCPGNQTCEYDPTTMTTSCAEATRCDTALGCMDDRQCVGGACTAPLTCQPDRYESNDQASEATDLNVMAPTQSLEATICSGDVDYFTFDTRPLQDVTLRGTLVITAEYARHDAGLGELEMELIDPQGTSVETATSGAQGHDGEVVIRADLGAASHGVYTVRVADHGDVSTAGVAYTLGADVITDAVSDACANAPKLLNGQTVNANTADGTSYAMGSTCTELHSDFRENVYFFELNSPRRVTLDASATTSGLDLSVAVRSTCDRLASEVACADAGQSGSETLSAVLPAGTYYAIVQPASGTTGGAYSLTMTTDPVSCSTADNACVDASTAKYCSDGSFATENCALGCDPRRGTCEVAEGDACRTATVMNPTFTETINWADYTNTYQMPAGGCVPGENGDTQSRGSDAVFQVTLEPGYGLSATLDLTDGEFGSLYLLDGCYGLSSACLDGSNSTTESTETVNYVNNDSRPKVLYIVADSAGGGQSTAVLSVQSGEIVCNPGTPSCDANGDAVRCNGAGTGTFVEEQCGYGCSAGACDQPPNDECSGAIALTLDQPVTSPIDPFANDVDPGASCTGQSAGGADGFYRVTTPQDDLVVTVDVDATYDAAVYAVESCGSVANGCMAGVDELGSAGAEQLQFYAPTAGDYFVAVDTSASSASGDFTITASVQQPQCTPGEIVGCSTSASGDLDYCNSVGLIEQFSCPSGACTGAGCDSPAGDVCFDAIPVTAGTTYSGTFAGAGDDIEPTSTDRCIFLDQPDGNDVFYSIDLAAGDILDAELSTNAGNATVYVVKDCTSDPTQACQWGRSDTTQTSFYAPTAGTYYIVVDEESTYADESFSLSVDVRGGGVCQPGGASCDPATGVLSHCSADGTELRPSVSCANGCSSQVCNPPATLNETCNSAYALGGAARVVDNWGRFADDHDPVGSCNITDANGPEAVYSVTMPPDSVLSAELVSYDTINYPRLYVATDCADVAGTCVAGAEDSGEPVSVNYYSASGGTVYVFADVDWNVSDDLFMLDVDVQPSECNTGDSQCVDADNAEVCNSYHVFERERCYYGCAAGQCQAPPNDTCGGATSVPKDDTWHTYTGPIDAYANDYDLSSTSGCTGGNSAGPDAVYAINVAAGDVIEADWTTPSDASVWITNACPTNVEDGCVAGEDDGSSNGHLTYTAPSSGLYYVVGDVDASSVSGNFQMKIRGITPQCDPATTADSCADADTREWCTSPGVFVQEACQFGCTNGACNPQSNDLCADAVDASAGGTFQGDFSQLSADYTPSGSACPGMGYSQSGPDATYVVHLSAGQTVDATLTSPTGTDVGIYAVTDCAALETSCVAGDDTSVSSGSESISYTASGAETLYIIADAYSSSTTSGTYDLDISVTP